MLDTEWRNWWLARCVSDLQALVLNIFLLMLFYYDIQWIQTSYLGNEVRARVENEVDITSFEVAPSSVLVEQLANEKFVGNTLNFRILTM